MLLLQAAFWGMLTFHLIHALMTHRGGAPAARGRFSNFVLVSQTPLFVIACYFTASQGLFSRQLVSPLYIALGVAAGHLVFGASLLITHRSWRDVTAYFIDLKPIWTFLKDSPLVFMRFTTVAIVEEIIWRSAAQPLLISATGLPLVGILAVAAAFCIVHEHIFTNPIMVTLEFLGFSLLLGVLFYFTHSLILVIVIHAVRDIEIAYLEYAEKADELGDPELALQEYEKSLTRRHLEKA